MQCREFREISEAYLSDQLLVETNLQVFGHMENCPKCREEFAGRRELRRKLRSAVKNASEFQIDPIFSKRLTADIKEKALYESAWRKFFFAPKLLIPVMASLLVAAALGFVFLSSPSKPTENLQAQRSITQGLIEISVKAAGDHEDCALEKLQKWEAMSKGDYAEKAVYAEKVVKPLQANSPEQIEMLHAHDCIFEGKRFTHVILRKGTHIVSVFFDKSDAMPEADNLTNASIISEKENGFQVASFQKNSQAVFVVSDMSETENLNVARTLSDAFSSQDSILG